MPFYVTVVSADNILTAATFSAHVQFHPCKVFHTLWGVPPKTSSPRPGLKIFGFRENKSCFHIQKQQNHRRKAVV